MFGLQRPEAVDFVSLFVSVFAFECIQIFFFQTLDAFSNRMLITFEYFVAKLPILMLMEEGSLSILVKYLCIILRREVNF